MNVVNGILSGLVTISKILRRAKEHRERTFDDDIHDYNKRTPNLSYGIDSSWPEDKAEYLL